jgi:hypothetical protein
LSIERKRCRNDSVNGPVTGGLSRLSSGIVIEMIEIEAISGTSRVHREYPSARRAKQRRVETVKDGRDGSGKLSV